MYVSRGRSVVLEDASRLPLRKALEELFRLGNGRLVYYLDNATLELEVDEKGRAGCIAEIRPGRVLFGDECLEELRKNLGTTGGVVELIELDKRRVDVDFSTYPQSLVSGGVETLKSIIEGEERRTTPRAKSSSPKSNMPAATVSEVAAPRAVETRLHGREHGEVREPAETLLPDLELHGFSICDLFNPAAAAAIAALGRRIDASSSKHCLEIVADLLMLRRRALLNCVNDELRLYVVIDPETKCLEALLEKEGDYVKLGTDAIREAALFKPTVVRVFVR